LGHDVDVGLAVAEHDGVLDLVVADQAAAAASRLAQSFAGTWTSSCVMLAAVVAGTGDFDAHRIVQELLGQPLDLGRMVAE